MSLITKMKIAVTPFMVLIVVSSFFARHEVLIRTGSKHGYLYADIAFIACAAIFSVAVWGFLCAVKYDPRKLLMVRATRKRMIDFFVFCLFLVIYVLVISIYGSSLVSSHLSIILVSLPLLIILYILELRWIKGV